MSSSNNSDQKGGKDSPRIRRVVEAGETGNTRAGSSESLPLSRNDSQVQSQRPSRTGKEEHLIASVSSINSIKNKENIFADSRKLDAPNDTPNFLKQTKRDAPKLKSARAIAFKPPEPKLKDLTKKVGKKINTPPDSGKKLSSKSKI